MKKGQLTFNFHNPNTEDETVRAIASLLAEVAFTKIQKRKDELAAEMLRQPKPMEIVV